MKFKRILSAVMASWIILAGGYSSVTIAESSIITNDVQETSAQTTQDPALTTPLLEAEVSSSPNNTLSNSVGSEVTSGNVNLDNNTQISSASTGDASATVTVITVDSQSSNGLDPFIDSYSINPPPKGNSDIIFMIDSTTSTNSANDLTLIPLSSELETVNNSIDLSSISGDLTANSNTSVGQLNTGDSYTNANIINILGSNVDTPEIFLGYITVDGDLIGDILLPDTFLQSTKIPMDSILYSNASYASDYKYNLANNVTADAKSGYIDASENSSIKNVGSGVATNMLNSQDLIGLNIYGQTGILVFVNVTGAWDGSILGQNKGVVSALLGIDGSNKTFLIPLTMDDNQKVLNVNNLINISSMSGSIAASKNSEIGDIKTGSATTVVNIANIIGSDIRFSDRFGILFITVLGNWFGSFAIDTPYGGMKVPIISNETETTVTESLNSSNLINKTTTYFSFTKKDLNDSDETDELIGVVKGYDGSKNLALTMPSFINNKKSNLLDEAKWLIPLMGGSIALGLIQKSKKISYAKKTK